MTYGARFLQCVIDEHVKIPISTHWQEGTTFRVGVRNAAVVVDVLPEQPVVTREGFEELACAR